MKMNKTIMGCMLTAGIISGCASNQMPSSEQALKQQLIEARKSEEVARKEAMSAKKRADSAEGQIATLVNKRNSNQPPSALTSNDMLPPNAKSGECYARVFVEPVYETLTQRKLVKDRSENISIVPAQYTWLEEKVKVSDEHEHLKVVPATYKWVEEQVMVEPARTVKVKVPAVYEIASETIIDKPAHSAWKKGTGPVQKINEATGEIMCLVDVPATYKTVTSQVLKTKAHTKSNEIPAIYKTVKRRVVDVPEHTVAVVNPAKYDVVKVKKLVKEEKVVRTEIPEEYAELSFQKKVKEGVMEWRSILCKTNITAQNITSIQQALASKGYNPGPIDGFVGRQTMDAVNSFQTDNDLPIDQYLNMATLKKLGL